MITNFFNISDLNYNNINTIFQTEINTKNLKDKSIGLLFEKYSTRTRLSFSAGISKLGGHNIDIRFEELNFSRDESFEDTFRAMDCYLDGLVYRTDNHQKLIQASKYFKKPIINALSDVSHPCQILSDLFTIQEHFGSLNCHILWMGDMNNVCFSLVEAANIIEDLKLTICTPKSISTEKNWKLGNNINILHKIEHLDLKIYKCIMTDVFLSMNDIESNEKVKLLHPYCVTSNLMSQTPSDSIFMHCLPANVGFEVDQEVFESSKSVVWKQALNRVHAQKSIINWCLA